MPTRCSKTMRRTDNQSEYLVIFFSLCIRNAASDPTRAPGKKVHYKRADYMSDLPTFRSCLPKECQSTCRTSLLRILHLRSAIITSPIHSINNPSRPITAFAERLHRQSITPPVTPITHPSSMSSPIRHVHIIQSKGHDRDIATQNKILVGKSFSLACPQISLWMLLSLRCYLEGFASPYINIILHIVHCDLLDLLSVSSLQLCKDALSQLTCLELRLSRAVPLQIIFREAFTVHVVSQATLGVTACFAGHIARTHQCHLQNSQDEPT